MASLQFHVPVSLGCPQETNNGESKADSASSKGLDLSSPALDVLVEPFKLVLFSPAGDFSIPISLLADSFANDPFFSIIRANGEINVTVTADKAKAYSELFNDASSLAPPSHWNVFKIRGPLDLNMIGVMATFSKVLQEAKVSLFVTSTHLTDYILVDVKNLDKAVKALSDAGWHVLP